MYFVIVRNDDGDFVALPGRKRSFTDKLQHAWRFTSKDEAQRNCCSNERVERYEDAGR